MRSPSNVTTFTILARSLRATPRRTRSTNRKSLLDTGTQTEKDDALAAKKPMFCLHAVTDEDCHPLKTKMDQAGDYVIIGVQFFRHAPKVRDITNVKLSQDFVQKAPDDIRWIIEFDELMVTKKESAPVLMAFRTFLKVCGRIAFTGSVQGIQTCAGRWHYPCAMCRK